MAESWALAADPHSRVFVTFLDQGHTTMAGSARMRRPPVDVLDRAHARLFQDLLTHPERANAGLYPQNLSVTA
jgi:hypothetical protein